MKQRTARNREHRTRPGEDEKLVTVKLELPKSLVRAFRNLERNAQVTGEQIFVEGLVTYEYCWLHR